ncbi:MAG: type II toxin-antitoxin system ParD family antitoxin [Parvularculaceae bacterium]
MSRNPTVHLTDHQQAVVENLIAGGRFKNVSEAVRAGLRLLEDAEAERLAAMKRLEMLAREGLASELLADFDPRAFIAQKRADYEKKRQE